MKGIQTQTAECLVIGEITTDLMVVVLNKTDMLPTEPADRCARSAAPLLPHRGCASSPSHSRSLPRRAKALASATKKIRKALSTTRFADAPFVAVSALAAASATPDTPVVDACVPFSAGSFAASKCSLLTCESPAVPADTVKACRLSCRPSGPSRRARTGSGPACCSWRWTTASPSKAKAPS